MNSKSFIGRQSGLRAAGTWGRVHDVTLLATLTALVSCTTAFAQSLEHGFGATKVCNPRCEGETMDCTMTGRHLDDFDDVTLLSDAWDDVSTGLGNLRVPLVGNLPIISIVGNAVCTNSGGICVPATGLHCALPCRLGQAGSIAGGLPGLAPAGRVQFRQNQYVIQPTDPDNMPDVAKFAWMDECDDPAGSSSCPNGTLVTPAGSNTDVIRCDDGDSCTTDCCVAGVCSNTSVCLDTACSPGNTPKSCEDNNVCTADACNDANEPTCCSNLPIPCPPLICERNTTCDPILGCQYVDDCRTGPLGTCCPDDGNPCTHEFCDQATGVCGATPDCTAAANCNDNDVCTLNECIDSCCEYTPIPCPPRPCFTLTGCDPTLGCQYISVCGTPGFCEDNNVCTVDVCDDTTGGCCTHTPILCPERPCFRIAGCDPVTGCIYVPDCRTGPLGTCCPDDGNLCTHAFCDQATGLCGSTPDCSAAADCNDDDVCTQNGCVNSCCEYTPIPCPERPCFRITGCDPIAGCQYESVCSFDPDFCDDNSVCTTDDCDDTAAGCCEHTPIICPQRPCFTLTGCDPVLGCQYTSNCDTPDFCDDHSVCTTDVCDVNAAGCCVRTPIDCPVRPCFTLTGCDPVLGCQYASNCDTPGFCDDHSVCTTDVCDVNAAGCCTHAPIDCPLPGICEISTGCNATTGCTYGDSPKPCCGDGDVTPPETCDPPGSPTPDGPCPEDCGKCGNGILDEDEECDPGKLGIPPIPCFAHDKPCKDTVCNLQCKCVKVPLPNGTIVPTDEECMDLLCQNGMPLDHPRPHGTACGSAVPEGVCDTPDSCNGKGNCDSNYKEAGTVCRAAIDVCDVPEPCSGLSGSCPPDTFAASGTPAPDDGEECTHDVCNGQGLAVHPPKARGTRCGNQTPGICDLPDSCDGAGLCDMNLIVVANDCRVARMIKLVECLRGPDIAYPDPTCFTVDMDQDDDVDHKDCSLMMD